MPELQFSADALAKGRLKALAVWNDMPTDLADNGPAAPSSAMVEDAAYAYAVLNECARIDSLKMPIVAGGQGAVVADPVPNLLKAMPTALQVVKDYARWVASTKPRLAAKLLEL